MKKRLLSSVLALVITLCGANFSVLNAASHGGGGDDHTPMGEEMEVISKSFRTIRRQAKDPATNAESAKLVDKMFTAAVEAYAYEPVWTSEQPAGEQKAFVEGFKKEMRVFIKLLANLEQAFEDGDNGAAEAIIGELRDQQKKSHKAYKKPDDD